MTFKYRAAKSLSAYLILTLPSITSSREAGQAQGPALVSSFSADSQLFKPLGKFLFFLKSPIDAFNKNNVVNSYSARARQKGEHNHITCGVNEQRANGGNAVMSEGRQEGEMEEERRRG